MKKSYINEAYKKKSAIILVALFNILRLIPIIFSAGFAILFVKNVFFELDLTTGMRAPIDITKYEAIIIVPATLCLLLIEFTRLIQEEGKKNSKKDITSLKRSAYLLFKTTILFSFTYLFSLLYELAKNSSTFIANISIGIILLGFFGFYYLTMSLIHLIDYFFSMINPPFPSQYEDFTKLPFKEQINKVYTNVKKARNK